MKIAYIVTVQFWKTDGLSKKIINQIDIWNRLGFETKASHIDTPYIEDSDLPELPFPFATVKASPSVFGKLNSSYKFAKFLRFPCLYKELDEYNPDQIYLRFELFKPFMLQIAKLKKKTSICLEVNMLDLEERQSLRFTDLLGTMIDIYNRITRGFVFRLSHKIVSVTHEIANDYSIAKYGRPSHVAYNSIDIFRKPTKSDQ